MYRPYVAREGIIVELNDQLEKKKKIISDLKKKISETRTALAEIGTNLKQVKEANGIILRFIKF